ncbi:MAG: DUF4386 family protein [Ktedonobacterales bacterium]
MSLSETEPVNARPKPAPTEDSSWTSLCRAGGVAGLIAGVLVIADILVFVVWPPPGGFSQSPSTVIDCFKLFHTNGLIGLLDFDLLGMIAYVFMVPVLLALYVTLRRASSSFMAIAVAFALMGIAVYFASNTAFSMLSVSSQYAAATTVAQRALLQAEGAALLTTFSLSAFELSYAIVSAALLIISIVMLRSALFNRATAVVGIVANAAAVLVVALSAPLPLLSGILSLLAGVLLGIWVFLIGRRLLLISQGRS